MWTEYSVPVVAVQGQLYSSWIRKSLHVPLINIPHSYWAVLIFTIWLEVWGFIRHFSEHKKSRIFLFTLTHFKCYLSLSTHKKSSQNVLVLRSIFYKDEKKHSSVYWAKAVLGQPFQAEISANRSEVRGDVELSIDWLKLDSFKQSFMAKFSEAEFQGYAMWSFSWLKLFNAIDSF